MSDNPLSLKNILAGVVVTILGGIPLAVIIQDARFDPQRSQNPTTPTSIPTEAARLSTPQEALQTPSQTLIQTPKPEPTISGEWIGTYTCSQYITGVTVKIDQTGNTVIADFYLYPPPEDSDISPGSKRYDGANGRSEYKGNFNATSRSISFPEGVWRKNPAPFWWTPWRAFGFYGEFDENLETFSGRMDHHSCTTINLTRKTG
jgi:hypothetical protein